MPLSALKRSSLGLLLALLLTGSLAWAQDRASDLLKGEAEDPAEEAAEEREETEERTVEEADEPLVFGDAVPVTEEPRADFPAWTGDRAVVLAVPITDTIAGPNEYVLRRALKRAIEQGADALVMEIDTPGGSVATLLQMMEHIDRFDDHGLTIAWVNDEAISAGALLAAVSDEIWYAPKAVIGSAGIVAGGGQEVPETMRQKVESYVQAKIRAFAGTHPNRAEVIRAMMDESVELEIDGQLISPEGRMLNLTAEEAMQRFGEPPTPLFGNGIASELDALLDLRFGEGNWEVTRLEVTWSEELAKYLTNIAPLLVAFGIVAVFIEMKTPGFGIFGVGGILLLGIVFATNYIMGLAGWEPFLLLLAGLALIAIEIFILPGTLIFLVSGVILVVASLLWSLTDVWPTIEGGVEVDLQSLIDAATSLSLAVVLGAVAITLLWKLLPQFGLFDHFVLNTAEPVTAEGVAVPMAAGAARFWPEVGSHGRVTRVLRPVGEVEIDGRRYEARAETGVLGVNEDVVVLRRLQFSLEVRKAEEG